MRKELPPDEIRALCQRGRYAPLDPQEIRALRESMHLKQREVSHALGYSVASVQAWERDILDKGHFRRMNRVARATFCMMIEALLEHPHMEMREVLRQAA